MTQIVNPSIDRVADSFLTAGSLAYAGLKEGGIVPSGQQTELAKQSAADETVLNGFAFSTSGLDVTVSAGEAFVFGSWIIKDTQTTVTLPASSTTKVYVGWNKDAANSVIIGRVSDFEDEDAKIEVGEFTTDSSTVTSESDLREFVSIDAERLEGKETSEIKPDISDSGATVVENVDDINVEGFSASDDGDGSATIVGGALYTDSDAISAVNSENSLSVNISGDANTVDGFSFVKDGNSGPGIINYQTGIEASGGTTVIDRTINGVDYRIHAFENVGSSTFSVDFAPPDATVDALIVAGGGGGANSGGGGAGGLIYTQSISVNDQNYNITVGDGGASNGEDNAGSNGGDSSAFGLIAIGGGGGGAARFNEGNEHDGKNGGSGGGASFDVTSSEGSAGSGVSGQGNDGGLSNRDGLGGGGGGGGAGQPGQNAFTDPNDNDIGIGGDGGDGLDYSNEFGTSFGENGYFAGGGAGGTNINNNSEASQVPQGGIGGGGNGSTTDKAAGGGSNPFGDPGIDGTGGGGGGSDPEAKFGSNTPGGSGIVLIQYEI